MTAVVLIVAAALVIHLATRGGATPGGTNRPHRFPAIARSVPSPLITPSPPRAQGRFVRRLRAALAIRRGTVRYEEWRSMATAPNLPTARSGPSRYWSDGRPPRRYRTVLSPPTDPSVLKQDPWGLLGDRPLEIGSTPGPTHTTPMLTLAPHDTLWQSNSEGMPPSDPISQLQKAIADGTVYDDGIARRSGRTVIRLHLANPSTPRNLWTYYYLDRKTLYPVAMTDIGSAPDPSSTNGAEEGTNEVFHIHFEDLPGTPANRALADIRAQHRTATVLLHNPIQEASVIYDSGHSLPPGWIKAHAVDTR